MINVTRFRTRVGNWLYSRKEGDDRIAMEVDPRARLQWRRQSICPACAGDGKINARHVFGSGYEQETCPRCNGSGMRIAALEKLFGGNW